MASGVTTKSFLVTVVSYSEQKFGSGLLSIAQSSIDFALLALSLIIALGGTLAILGGGLVLLKHRLTGKTLIALGGGFGFIGIVIAMGYDVFTTVGISVIVTHFEYWIGVLVASIGRYLI